MVAPGPRFRSLLDPRKHGVEVLDAAAEAAEVYPPVADDELCVWCFVVFWREKLQERGLDVPRELERIYRNLQKRVSEETRRAENLRYLLEDVPPDLQEEAFSMILDAYERLYREDGRMVPMWVGIARSLFTRVGSNDDSTGGEPE